MIFRNPENAKITNEYLYNLLHTGALYGRKDIISLAIDKVKLIVPFCSIQGGLMIVMST